MNIEDLLSGYEAPEIGGEINDSKGAEFTGVDFEFESDEPEPIEGELDFNGEPLEFEDLEEGDLDFEDLEAEELEETEVIKSPEKD